MSRQFPGSTIHVLWSESSIIESLDYENEISLSSKYNCFTQERFTLSKGDRFVPVLTFSNDQNLAEHTLIIVYDKLVKRVRFLFRIPVISLRPPNMTN